MQFDTIYLFISLTLFAVTLIFIGKRYKRDSEVNYPLFIFLYFYFGSFKFEFNHFPIPLGFIICLLFLYRRPLIPNQYAKTLAIYIGLLSFIASLAVPYYHNQYLTRLRQIEVTNLNSDNFSFTKQYRQILDIIDKDIVADNAMIIRFNLSLENDNLIERLSYEIHLNDDSIYRSIYVSMSGKTNRISIRPQIKEKDNYYNVYFYDTNALTFFTMLDKVKLSKMKYDDCEKTDFMISDNVTINKGNNYYENYVLENDSYVIANNIEYRGDLLICFGMLRTTNGYQSVKHKTYIYNMQYNMLNHEQPSTE